MKLGEKVNVYADAFLYGERDVLTATPEEVAFLSIILSSNPNFLQCSCKQKTPWDSRLGLLKNYQLNCFQLDKKRMYTYNITREAGIFIL
jgi:hypothetical protein